MALPTTLDNLNATMYALDRIKKDRCLSESKKTAGLKYQEEDSRRMYPCPRGISECGHGKCVITTDELCKSKSMTPFDANGNDLNGKPCSTSESCNADSLCGENKKCYPKKPYLEFHNGKCVYGNFALRRWCQFPTSRGDSGKHPDTGNPYNPFQYDEKTGKCYITKEYCEKDMQTSFKIDDKGRPTCYTTTGDEIGQFFLGKTIFRGIKGAVSGDFYQKEMPIHKNFAGDGVHLYMKNGFVGFNENEIKKRYPEVFNASNDITFTLDDIKNDRNKKRIYFVEKNSHWLSGPILKAIFRKLT